jgi:hypothetical protein
MNRRVAQLNIEHFRKKLAVETDATKREMLLRLLAEEEAKLAAARAVSEEERRG